MLFLLVAQADQAFAQAQQKGSSIVIHDTTTARNGGEGATQSLRNEIAEALKREKPCVETMDDQDIKDAIQDERERATLEGGDSTATLQNLGNKLGSSMVMTVQAMPGPNGVVYSVAVMDTKTGRTVAREMGSDPKQLADKIVSSMGSYLADSCKPHWTGTIEYAYTFNESKQKNDAGPMRAASRNTKRTLTETSNMQTSIKATLLSPASGSVNSTTARVRQRVNFTFQKKSSTSGELYCREPGKNPYFKGFSEEYTETTTQLGQGTNTMPVSISIDDDGSYTINVTAPGGVLLGKIETSRNSTGCGSANPAPTIDAVSMPEGKLEATSFDAAGKTDPKNRDVLAGSQTSPDGRTKITWKLRLVKPKGKG
ncbi:MAG: hypothetical protein KA447_07755 [Pyrinomonadaceae bacterium]|nr:hypothetical protein [Pyrinomonadaceae bacterium]